MDESKYAQDALDTLALHGMEGTGMAQVFATLAVVELLSDIHDALFRLHEDLELLTNQVFLSRVKD